MKFNKGIVHPGILVIGFIFLLLAGIFITLKTQQPELPSLFQGFQNSPQSTHSPEPTSSYQPTLTPQPTFTPQPTPTPQPTSQQAKLKIVNLNEEFSMSTGDEVEVSNTGLKIKITSIITPQEGTFDLPNSAGGQATYQGQAESFSFTVGGNQPQEIANQRRQKDVFNLFNIYAHKVTDSEITLIVKRI